MVDGMSESETQSMQSVADSGDPREQKLPAWARDLLATERRLRRAAEQVAAEAALATKPAESGALLDRYADVPIGLGADPRVAFRVPFPGYRVDMSFIEIRLLHSGPGITIHATDEIVCRQRAINAVDVVPWPNNKHTIVRPLA
jgi:hypothetical protein